MEGGVEYGNVRNAGHELLAGADADQICRIVQRGKFIAVLDRLDRLVGDQAGSGELLAAVYDTVSNRADLRERADHALLRVGQGIDDCLQGFLVGRHRDGALLLLPAGRLVGQRAVDADSLTEALCKNLLGLGIDQLVLEG